MADKFIETYFTPSVLEAQKQYYGRARRVPGNCGVDELGSNEINFIAQRDSFYMATVSSNNWPYIQHRGGPPGFLKPIETNLLAFADYQGNGQLLSTGNLADSGKVALFLMDYRHQQRLKIMGYARVLDARDNPQLVNLLTVPAERKIVERIFKIDVVSYDWNCPKFITRRYTEEDLNNALEPLRRRVAELEARQI